MLSVKSLPQTPCALFCLTTCSSYSCQHLLLCSTRCRWSLPVVLNPSSFHSSALPRWHPDWYDGEKGSAGGGSHQSSRTRTKARIQIPPWWEPSDTKKQLIPCLPLKTSVILSSHYYMTYALHPGKSSTYILVASGLYWRVAVFLTNGFFYRFVSAFSSICQGLSAEQWSVRSQKENQDCTENTWPTVPASTAIRGKPTG